MPSLAPCRDAPIQNPRRTTSTEASAHLAGLIMWLPRRNRLPDHPELPEGCYQHPVVILSEQPSATGDVVVLILTSFGETDIHEKFPRKRDRKLRLTYLPIHPSRHPDTTTMLHLEGHVPLRCKTYVNTREKHTVPFDLLRSYDRDAAHIRYALTSDSYKQLAHRAGFVSPLATLPPRVDTDDAATDKGSTTTTTTMTTTTRPVPVTSERQRLFPEPVTHDHPLASRPQAAGYANISNNRSAAIQDYYYTTAPQTTRQTLQPPSYQTGDTLPRYYQPHAAAGTENNSSYNNTGINGEGAGWGDKLGSLAKLAVGIVVVGTAIFGLWSVGMGGRRRDLR